MKTPETLAELFDRGAIISGSKYLTVEKLADGRVTIRADIPPPITGACCLPDDSCSILTAAACAAAGGIYQGDETSCDPDPCAPACPANATLTLNKTLLVQNNYDLLCPPGCPSCDRMAQDFAPSPTYLQLTKHSTACTWSGTIFGGSSFLYTDGSNWFLEFRATPTTNATVYISPGTTITDTYSLLGLTGCMATNSSGPATITVS